MTEYYRPVQMRKLGIKGKLWVVGFFGLTGLISLLFWGWGRLDQNRSIFGEMKISYVYEPEKKSGGEKIVEEIKKKVAGEGKYSVYVYSVNDKTGYGFNEEVKMPTMSMAKVPIMVAVYREVQKGNLKLSRSYTILEEQAGDGDEEATAEATPKLIARTVTLEKMLEEMGKRSNNAAAAGVIKILGKEKIIQTMTLLGMKNSDFDENETTASDVAAMWVRLVENKDILEEVYKDKLWDNLQDSIYEDRIAAGVPKDTQLIHKVGTDVDVWSDAGIVQCSVLSAQCLVKPFIVVILNDEVDLEVAQKTVPEIVKMVWTHEVQRGNTGTE